MYPPSYRNDLVMCLKRCSLLQYRRPVHEPLNTPQILLLEIRVFGVKFTSSLVQLTPPHTAQAEAKLSLELPPPSRGSHPLCSKLLPRIPYSYLLASWRNWQCFGRERETPISNETGVKCFGISNCLQNCTHYNYLKVLPEEERSDRNLQNCFLSLKSYKNQEKRFEHATSLMQDEFPQPTLDSHSGTYLYPHSDHI